MSDASDGERTIRGADLLAYLEGDEALPRRLRVDPPPLDWAPIKPALMERLRHLRGAQRDALRIQGIPRCLFGSEHPSLPPSVASEAAPDQCLHCRLLVSCSPPSKWSEGLAPYSSDPLDDRWLRWREVYDTLLAPPSPSAHEHFEAARADIFSIAQGLKSGPLTLEPSLVVRSGQLSSSLRFGLFHGRLPRDPASAQGDTQALVQAAEDLQRRHFGTLHISLSSLTQFGPFCLPMGLELEGEQLHLKLYLRLPEDTLRREAMLGAVSELCGLDCAGSSQPAAVDMIGIGVSEQGLSSLKSYVRADPTRPDPAWGLPACASDDRLVRLSRAQAYAVLDASHARAPKWDFNLRRAFLGNQALASGLGVRLEGAEGPLREWARLMGTRMDCIAAGWREDALTLYIELS